MRVQNVVTSFNEEGYQRYGRAFVDSFLEFWPKNIRLTVYYECDNFTLAPGMSWHPIEKVEYLMP